MTKLTNLPPRLQALADLLPDQMTRFYDVGCDHALLPLYLLQRGRADEAYAIDINADPLELAKARLRHRTAFDRLRFVQNDGLKGLALGEDPTILIAGLGGYEIAKILLEAPLQKGQKVFVQVNWHWEPLREQLASNGWRIVDEWIVEEKWRTYVVMLVEKDEAPYTLSALETYAGPILLDKLQTAPTDVLIKGFKEMHRVLKKRTKSGQAEDLDLLRALEAVLAPHLGGTV